MVWGEKSHCLPDETKKQRENRGVGRYAIKAEESLLFLDVCLLQASGVITISTFIPGLPWLMRVPWFDGPQCHSHTQIRLHTHTHACTHLLCVHSHNKKHLYSCTRTWHRSGASVLKFPEPISVLALTCRSARSNQSNPAHENLYKKPKVPELGGGGRRYGPVTIHSVITLQIE